MLMDHFRFPTFIATHAMLLGAILCGCNTVPGEAVENTECSVSVSPPSGDASTPFEISYKTSGKRCTWALDGVMQGEIDCESMDTRSLPPGNHSIILSVVDPAPDTPEEATSCTSNVVRVAGGDGLASCSVSISPSDGTTDTPFEASYASDAASCTWALDGIDQGEVECTSTQALSLLPGQHSITLTTSGPEGSSVCTSNVVTVSGEGAPSCSVSIDPFSGTTDTTFDVVFESDATTCSWVLDGSPQGETGCSGKESRKLTAGDHFVTFTAVGPNGTSICTSNTAFVEGEAELPTCLAFISPDAGTETTEFEVSYNSNARLCSLSLDGIGQGTVPCNGSETRTFFPGSHSVTLTAMGLNGATTSCSSKTVFVEGDAPMCTITLTPIGGDEFNVSWGSDADTCTWRIDELNQGSVDCGGDTTLTLPPGQHTVSLVATSSGRTTVCTSDPVTVEGDLPICTVFVSPGTGDTNTIFEVDWQTDADQCSWALDGASQGSIDCAGGPANTTAPVGTHTVSLTATNTATGASNTCKSNEVTVTQAEGPPPKPTCEASIDPNTGTTQTEFVAEWSATNATSCTWKLDGDPRGPVDCDGSVTSTLPIGSHKVTLVATGPGGTTECDSNSVSVTEAPPTCIVKITPDSGTTTTNFTATWSTQNAATCRWALNGETQPGTIPCTGDTSFTSTLPAGSHYVSVLVTSPSGVNNTCRSNSVLVSAPPKPTCSVRITPDGGTTATLFTARWDTSNANVCRWTLDGVLQSGTINCTGQGDTFFSSRIDLGRHNVGVVMDGPGGSGSCTSNTVNVTAPAASCTVRITPTSGTTSTTFTATWSTSNATECRWSFDGVPQDGTIPCTGNTSFSSTLGAGSHYVSVSVTGDGPSGSCRSNTVQVQ